MARISIEDLLSVWTAQQAVEKEKRRLADLNILALPHDSRLTARLDGLPHATAVPVNFERIATMIVDCRLAIERLAEDLDQRKCRLLTILQALPLYEIQQRVLSYRYVACFKFVKIAEIMNCTSVYVHRLHRKALHSLGLSLDDLNRYKHSVIFVPSSLP